LLWKQAFDLLFLISSFVRLNTSEAVGTVSELLVTLQIMETIIWPLDATVAQPEVKKWEFLWQYNITLLKSIIAIIDCGLRLSNYFS
jgi:hypothetical protein